MTKMEDDILYIEKKILMIKPVLQNIKKTKNISKNVLFKKSIRKSLFILLLLCLIYLIINYSSKISFTNKRNSTTTKEEFINKTEKELENINKNQTLIKDESKNKLEELKNKEDISKQKLNEQNAAKESSKKDEIIYNEAKEKELLEWILTKIQGII